MSSSEIRKAVEKRVIDAINPIKIDLEEDGLGGDETSFVRISAPIIIKEIADMGASIYHNNCKITIKIFADTKANAMYIFDDITDAFDNGFYFISHNGLKIYTVRNYTEFSGKDTLGSYYQLNCGIEFYTYTQKS